MKTAIGIFQGKQRKYDEYLLETLYNNGPLTAWEMTEDVHKGSRISRHATYNKRLRDLEKKGYIRRVGKQWHLQYKGIIAVLLIQPEPRPWSQKWTKLVENYAKSVEEMSKQMINISYQIDGRPIEPVKVLKRSAISLRRFGAWVGLAKEAKRLMEHGVINFDVIKNKALLSLIFAQLSDDVLDESLGDLK